MGEFISPKMLETFLRKPEFTIEKRNLAEIENESDYLYKYGLACDYFIIILDGNATVQVGREKGGMEISAGLFSYYGVDALLYENETDPLKSISLKDNERKQYEPEFSLKVNSYCVFLKIKRSDWKDAVRKSLIERTYINSNSNADSPSSLIININDTSNTSILA